MSVNEAGRYAESMARQFLKDRGYRVFQADWIGWRDGQWYLFEVKHQDRFNPPPFAGQGLPPYQVVDRLRFQQDVNVRCILLVLDKTTKEWFCQFLDVLNKGEHHDTNRNVRRIYPLSAFERFDPINEKSLWVPEGVNQ